jgi:hypothetical protein
MVGKMVFLAWQENLRVEVVSSWRRRTAARAGINPYGKLIQRER